jgi:hypothetical protein
MTVATESHELLEEFHSIGYAVIRGALRPQDVAIYRDSMAELYHDCALRHPPYSGNAGNERDISVVNALSAFSELIPLIDHPKVFGYVLALMGPYIHVAGAEIIIRFPNTANLLPLHTDGGPSLRELLPNRESNYLALKCQFFLSPCLLPNHANFCVVPGSHLHRFPTSAHEVRQVAVKQLLLDAGDAVIFPWSLWHGASSHEGQDPRESIIIKYAQRWAQPQDNLWKKERVKLTLSSRQEQLLSSLHENPGSDVLGPYKWASMDYLNIMFGEDFAAMKERDYYSDVIRLGKELYET